eukprot:TRINITY_DN205_c1_g3_i1.p1 TRINITY_DN205_c1_g3~~TRINITY_DN205_c1_g3_i1.p1  ORF type:complete len:469 (+),score=40.39 TRINITY_DN205_c1_g3_i1:1810-3216(+)
MYELSTFNAPVLISYQYQNKDIGESNKQSNKCLLLHLKLTVRISPPMYSLTFLASILQKVYFAFQGPLVDDPCYECGEKEENWVCLTCAKVGCSRYKNDHMRPHCEKEKHCIALSFSDMSFWCYECDSYITSNVLGPVQKKFQTKKFGELPTTEALVESLGKLKIEEEVKKEPPTKELDLKEVLRKLAFGHYKKIAVLSGAGISVNAGIPDFRTPGTGLYSQLEKYKLPFPEAIFALDYFLETPEPFYKLASEMFGKKYLPTKAHYFIRLLQEKGLLLRNYTQNIDNLEAEAGVKEEFLVQAHGTYTSSHCTKCKEEVSSKDMMEAMKSSTPKYCEKCKAPCKPDIVFFGEALPRKFFDCIEELRNTCDLMIIMGTSLAVMPFCMLPLMSPKEVPKLVLNNEVPDLFKEDKEIAHFFMDGDCDESVEKLIKTLKWDSEFETLMKEREEFAKKHGIVSVKKQLTSFNNG